MPERDSILDAAERLIGREGVRHLTIGRVAEEAAVSRGGLFYHFPISPALLRQIVARLEALTYSNVSQGQLFLTTAGTKREVPRA